MPIAPGRWSRVRTGATAGFGTILITTLINLAGRSAGILSPAMDLREMSALFVDRSRHPRAALAAGIVVHILSGITEGGLYGVAVGRFSVRSGIAFMAGMWLVMMLVAFPLMGKGWFGLQGGVNVPAATFVLHIVFGMLLGWWSARLRKS